MKSILLFGLLLASQALPLAMRPAAAQSDATLAGVAEERVQRDDRYDAQRLRTEYNYALNQTRRLKDKRPAYMYDQVWERITPLANGDTTTEQDKRSYARDQDGRMRIAFSLARGVQRVAIVDPTTQTAYLVRPERKDILRMSGAALALPPTPPSDKPLPDYYNSGVSTKLGEKEIDGVKVTGSKTEYTVPAGLNGNEKPMVQGGKLVCPGTWYSYTSATIRRCTATRSPACKTSSLVTFLHPRLPCRKVMPFATWSCPRNEGRRE